MIFVLFFRRGIMGDHEFSSLGMVRGIVGIPKKIAGLFHKKKKAEEKAI